MRRFLVYCLPVITLVVFILIMLSGSFLKQSIGNNDDFQGSLELIIKDIESDDWEAAKEKASKLSDVWDKIERRIQFSLERDEINAIYMNIARLRGAILAKDKSGSLMELYEAYEHWNDLGK